MLGYFPKKGGNNIDNDFKQLAQVFENIKSKGFVKSVTEFKNGAGITLESLLNCGSTFCFPDYNGIEIKAVKNYYDSEFDLFNLTPDSNHVFSTQWLSNRFGYPDKVYKNIRVFKGNVYANKLNKIGLFYSYRLRIDYNIERIILDIYNYKQEVINSNVYWDFKYIKEKLELKLNKLAIITFDKIYTKGSYYYYYKHLKMYKLKSFERFLELIENGTIFVVFKTGVNKNGRLAGVFQDHGTSFKISKANLENLFDKVY